MTESSDVRQRWLGVITLIICGVILAGLLLPAVNITHTPARRTQCVNCLKNFALATISFETTKKQYPGYQSSFGREANGKSKIGSWAVSLLPWIEQQVLRDDWDDPEKNDLWATAVKGNDEKLLQAFYPNISLFICPSDPFQDVKYGRMSYAVNAGFQLMPNDPALSLDVYANESDASKRSAISQRSSNGLFANRLGPSAMDPKTGQLTNVFGYHEKPIRSDDVREDGLSNTIMFSENCNKLSWSNFSIVDDSSRTQLGIVWLYAGASSSDGRPKPMAVTAAMRINHNKKSNGTGSVRARPSSLHPGVVNASMADGSTKGISEEIDYHVYQSLMAPKDATSDIPNVKYVLKEEDFML